MSLLHYKFQRETANLGYVSRIVSRGVSGPQGPQGAAGAGIDTLTTKGDLLGYSTTGARIPVGTNTHVLTADSTQALGLKWAAPDVTQAELDAVASAASSALSSHESDTTSVHGITDTSTILLKTLVDAKGDLIVASAADTPARLAVGTNGQVLTADSAETTGLKWAAASGGGGFTAYNTMLLASSQIDTGVWGIPGVGTEAAQVTTSLGSQPGGRMLMAPFLVSSAITITNIGIKVATAATAGNRCRLAIYAYAGATPVGGALVSDVGTVTVDSTGDKTIGSLSIALAAGMYTAAVLFEASTTIYATRVPVWWLSTQYNDLFSSSDIDMWYRAQAFGAAPANLSSTFGGGANSNGGFLFPVKMKWSQG